MFHFSIEIFIAGIVLSPAFSACQFIDCIKNYIALNSIFSFFFWCAIIYLTILSIQFNIDIQMKHGECDYPQ